MTLSEPKDTVNSAIASPDSETRSDETEAPDQSTSKTEPYTQQFNLLRQYVKDISLEFPAAPQIFNTNDENQIDLDITSGSKKIEETIYEVELMASIVIRTSQKKVLLIIECKQAGIFEIINMDPLALDVLLNVHVLELLFPYLRELVSSLSLRTSLPPILLPPTNFLKLYQQNLKKR